MAEAQINQPNAFIGNLPVKNILKNGGFEPDAGNNNRITSSWTASGGTFSAVTSGSNLLSGSGSVTWDSSAASQTLTSLAVTVPNGLKGKSGAAFCSILTPSGTATHTIQVFDGTNVLASTSIVSSTSPVTSGVSFLFPSSGSVSLRLVSVASNEPLIAIDDCFLGGAEGVYLSNVAQPNLIGHAFYGSTTNCTGWSRTSTSMGDFASDVDCPAPTIVSNVGPGTILSVDNNLPQITVEGLPPGRYEVRVLVSVAASASALYRMAVTDGTTTSAASGFNPSTTTNEALTITGIFTYTTARSSVTFKLQGMSSSGTLTISNDYYETQFYIYRFPTTQEQAYRADQLANSWSGYHDNTCSWPRASATVGAPTADASCALVERSNQNFGTVSTSGGVLPAITFTPKRAGRYYACAYVKANINTSSAGATVRLTDGTTVISDMSFSIATTQNVTVPACGIYRASSTSPVTLSVHTAVTSGTITINNAETNSIEWSIFQIDQSLPAPVLAQSVVGYSPGVVRIVSAFISNSGTPTVTRQDGNWISSLIDNGVGDTTININSGVFSTVPNCVCTLQVAAAEIGHCNVDTTTAPSTTVLRLQTTSTVPADIDRDFHVICMGAP